MSLVADLAAGLAAAFVAVLLTGFFPGVALAFAAAAPTTAAAAPAVTAAATGPAGSEPIVAPVSDTGLSDCLTSATSGTLLFSSCEKMSSYTFDC